MQEPKESVEPEVPATPKYERTKKDSVYRSKNSYKKWGYLGEVFKIAGGTVRVKQLPSGAMYLLIGENNTLKRVSPAQLDAIEDAWQKGQEEKKSLEPASDLDPTENSVPTSNTSDQ